MIEIVILIVVGMFSLSLMASAAGVWFWDPFGWKGSSDSSDSSGSDGTNDSSDSSDSSDPYAAENCVTNVRKLCDGKRGNDRTTCFAEHKKACMAIGGKKWDPEGADADARNEGLDEHKYADLNGTQIVLPESARDDTDENCAYFYDAHPYPWSKTEGGTRSSRKWCISDGVGEDKQISQAHGLVNSLQKDQTDYVRVGKNVAVTLYKDQGKRGWEGDKWFGAEGAASKKLYGSDGGNKKVYDMRDATQVGNNKLDGFRLDKL